MSNHLLVVGGTGFIGRWITQGGLDRGYKVSVLARVITEDRKISSDINYIAANLSDRNEILLKIKDLDITHVINLGGGIDHTEYRHNGRSMINVHFVGLLNLVEALNWSKLESFVQIGSSDEYGNADSPQLEDSFATPISSYSLGKFAASQFLKMLYITLKGFLRQYLGCFWFMVLGRIHKGFCLKLFLIV